MKSVLQFVLLSCLASSGICEAKPQLPSEAQMRKAALQIYSADCGLSHADPGYEESEAVLKKAGPAVLPVVARIIAEKACTPWFIGNASRAASRFPVSRAFDDALRSHRDDKDFNHDPSVLLGVFEYYATHGDEADLKWIEAKIAQEPFKGLADSASISKFSERLKSEAK